MTEPTADKPTEPIKPTHLDLNEVRDLLIMAVPEPWGALDNDDHIRARCEQEVTVMLLTGPRIMREVGGGFKPRPHIVGNIRNYDTRIVRKPEDLEGLVVDHDDCTECTDSIAELRKGPLLPYPVMAVVQFTYDEIADAR